MSWLLALEKLVIRWLKFFYAQTPPPFNLVGFIDDDPQKLGQSVFDFPVISQSFELLDIIETHKISDIVVAISGSDAGRNIPDNSGCARAGC